MSDDQIVRNCAPTLAGIKTGSLFNVSISSDRDFKQDIISFNRSMRDKGIRISDPLAASILKRFGYSLNSSDSCVAGLVKRLKSSPKFPHEIGLFLGYPPADVDGFIKSPNEGFCEVGYWKVYSDVENAREAFRRFKKCTEEYGRMLRSGRTLEQLVV